MPSKERMTVERILGYMEAVYAAIKHKRVPFGVTAFRKNYGISPHVHSAMLASGIIYKDNNEWLWLSDKPSMEMATLVFAGYKTRINRYSKNAAVTRQEEEERRKAMERLFLMKKGADNKSRLQEVLNKTKVSTPLPIPTYEDKYYGESPSEEEDTEVKEVLNEVVDIHKERQALVEMDYMALEEKVMALMAMSDKKFNALSEDIKQLVAMNRRLLKLHGADGV